jgi:uncharacterized UBP type Zn finger protein
MITNPTKHVHASDRLYALLESGELSPSTCAHVNQVQDVEASSSGCEECLKAGMEWVNLRICLVCGHVGCCESSPNRHAMQHYHATGHPIIQSFNPGETWIYCYADDALLSS